MKDKLLIFIKANPVITSSLLALMIVGTGFLVTQLTNFLEKLSLPKPESKSSDIAILLVIFFVLFLVFRQLLVWEKLL